VKLHDDEHQHLVNQVVLAEQWMRAELDKQPSARILVHCKAGVSRSASLVIAYLIMEHGYTYDAALAEVRERREIANPNPSFEEQLRSMEHVQRRTLAVHTKLLRPVQRAYEPYTSDVTF
jgi:atypical dual specificity phosphatase